MNIPPGPVYHTSWFPGWSWMTWMPVAPTFAAESLAALSISAQFCSETLTFAATRSGRKYRFPPVWPWGRWQFPVVPSLGVCQLIPEITLLATPVIWSIAARTWTVVSSSDGRDLSSLRAPAALVGGVGSEGMSTWHPAAARAVATMAAHSCLRPGRGFLDIGLISCRESRLQG